MVLLPRFWSSVLVMTLEFFQLAATTSPRYVQVTSPSSLISTEYEAGFAHFGYNLTGAAPVGGVLKEAEPFNACSTITNTALIGKIAIVERGSCYFILKAWNIQEAGAIGGIVIDKTAGSTSESEPPLQMTGSGYNINIPLLFLYHTEGHELLDFMGNMDVHVLLTDTSINFTTSTTTSTTLLTTQSTTITSTVITTQSTPTVPQLLSTNGVTTTTTSTTTSTASPTTVTQHTSTSGVTTANPSSTTSTASPTTITHISTSSGTPLSTSQTLTTSPTSATQSPPIFLLPCQCSTGAFEGKTNEEIIQELISDMTIVATNTSSSKRKLQCAVDTRSSSQAIGYGGIIVSGIGFGFIVFIDLIRIYQFCFSKDI